MPSAVSGVILAAGRSSRFRDDVPKQLVTFRGEPLIRRVTRRALASRLHQILVVVGYRGSASAAVLAGLAVEVVDNRDFERGQSSSVRCAVERIEPHATAALFLPVDQPFVTRELIDLLIETFETTAAPIVIPTHDGKRGSPVLVARELFSELGRIRGDVGGRQIFRRHEDAIIEVEVADRLAMRDINTRDDYETLLRLAATVEG